MRRWFVRSELASLHISDVLNIGLISGKLGGQDINLNLSSCSSTHISTILALCHRASSHWNIPVLVGKTEALNGCNWSTVTVTLSTAFIVYSTTISHPRDYHENIS
ncbi:unnamed protein product [Ixodes pacificus]